MWFFRKRARHDDAQRAEINEAADRARKALRKLDIANEKVLRQLLKNTVNKDRTDG